MENDINVIEAAANSKPKVVGVAYRGGKLKLSGWKYPVVVDLMGMKIPDTVPLLTNHENKTDARIGLVVATVKDNTLEISGEIISETKEAQDIIAQGKAGADWQLSIGADIKSCELVEDSRIINGLNQEGVFYHVGESILREVSVVAVGADANTAMKVSASFKFNNTVGEFMANENVKPDTVDAGKVNASANVAGGVVAQCEAKEQDIVRAEAEPVSGGVNVAIQLAIKAERERVADIQRICVGEYADIESEAINAGWTPEVVAQKVLTEIRANRPLSNLNVAVKKQPEGSDMKKTICAALALRAGVPAENLTGELSEPAVEAGMKMQNLSLPEITLACAKLDGGYIGERFNGDETIRAAFSSVSLPGILSNVANKRLLMAYQAQPVIATRLCSEGDLKDFKESTRYRLTDVGDLKLVAQDGKIESGGVTEESAKNKLETYAKNLVLTRQMIINDDLGAFLKIPAYIGNRAARLVDQLFFKRLMSNPTQSDGSALFHANHKNLLTGSTSALSAESLRKAVEKFLDQVDADGQPISIEPRYLVVPSALKHLAVELTQGATLIMSGGTDKSIRPAMNALINDGLEVISSPYLNNALFTGNSATAFYLFGDPATVDTWEIGYLAGKRTPTIQQGNTDFNTLGMYFSVFFDVGVREQDFRGQVKSVGA